MVKVLLAGIIALVISFVVATNSVNAQTVTKTPTPTTTNTTPAGAPATGFGQ